jgi:hypothetical protein
MNRRRLIWIALGIILSVAVVVVVTLTFTPQETNPAFAAATAFMNAAFQGDDDTAFTLLSLAMQQYVTDHCPNGSVSACIKGYTPPAYGEADSAIYRRAAPDGGAWDVELIAAYPHDKGASGVCIYERMEPSASGAWQVAGWAGFLWCGDSRSRDMASNPDTPNRAP